MGWLGSNVELQVGPASAGYMRRLPAHTRPPPTPALLVQGSKLLKDLEKEQAAVEACRAAAAKLGHDPAAAAQLEEAAEAQAREVRRWHDRVDELSSQLAGALQGRARRHVCWPALLPCASLALGR